MAENTPEMVMQTPVDEMQVAAMQGDFWTRSASWVSDKLGIRDYIDTRIEPYFMQHRRRIAATGLAVALSPAVLAACSGNSKHNSESSSFSAAKVAAVQGYGLTGDLTIHESTDTDLSHGGYNCGHTIEVTDRAHYDYSNQIDYLNSKPELIKNVQDFMINGMPNHSELGMGQDAWDVLAKGGIANTDTPDSKKVSASGDTSANDVMDKYSHLIHTVELPTDSEYLNFTCSNAQGDITPIHAASLIRLKVTNHVSGIVVDQQTLDEFNKVVRKDANGNSTFDVKALGQRTVNGKNIDVFMIVTEAEGCNNQERKIPPELLPPTTQPVETTAPNRQTSTTGGTNTTVVVTTNTTGTTVTTGSTTTTIPQESTTVPPKTDPGVTPGPNASTTTQPAPEGDPTVDDGSQNPVGGTSTTATTAPQGPPATEPQGGPDTTAPQGDCGEACA